MKQLALHQPGLSLSMFEADIQPPAPHQVQVEISAVGLNPADAKAATDGLPEWSYPHVPGLDAVGRIAAIGSEVTHLKCGQRVMWHGDLRADGALAERANIAEHLVSPVTDEIDDLRAAALPCAGMTALQSIERMQLKSRQTVLIEAGAGGVGYYAIQLAKKKGANVITTASEQHREFLGAIGADKVIDYHREDLAEVVRDYSGQLDAVLDSVDGQTSARDMALLRRGGHFVSLLGLPKLDGVDLFAVAPTIHIIGIGGAHRSGSPQNGMHELAAMSERLITMLAEGELQSPTIARVAFEADAVSEALERELSGKMAGKQVVLIH